MSKNKMELKLFFISYSVIYAKYNYCFEVSKDMPLRYFDGKEWKLMKPRNSHFKTRDSIIYQTDSIDYPDTMKQTHTTVKTEPTNPFGLRLAELIKEIKGIEPEATPPTTQNEPTRYILVTTEEITIQTTPTEKATIITKQTQKTTTKPTTLKKKTTKTTKKQKTTIITKPIPKIGIKTTITKKAKFKRVATLKFSTTKLHRQITNTTKTTNKFQRLSCCESRFKRTTKAKKIEPRLLKTMTKKIYNKILNLHWRPTYPPSPKSTNMNATRTTKKSTPKITTETTSIEEFTTDTTTSEKITTETTTTEKATITVTQTPETTKELPATTKKPTENTGMQDEAGALLGDMTKLMREFLKFVEAKKCKFPCKPVIRGTERVTTEPTNTEPTTTEPTNTEPTNTEPTNTEPTTSEVTTTEVTTTERTTMPFAMLLVPDNQSAMSDTDELMSILMGVKIDDKINEDDKNISQSKALRQGPDKLRITPEKELQNEKTKHIKEDNDTLEFNKQRKFLKDLKAILYERINNKTFHISGTETYSDELKGKNFRANLDEPKSYETIRVSGKEAYLDKLEDTNAKIFDDIEIEPFLNRLKNKHAMKKKQFLKDNEAHFYLGALNAGYSENTDRNEERNALRAIKDAYSRSVKDNLQNVPKAMFHSNELYNLLPYMTPTHTRFTEIKSPRYNEYDFKDREKTRPTSNLEVIESIDDAEILKVDQFPRSYAYTTITNIQNAFEDL